MKKLFSYSLLMMIVLNLFMNNINVFSYEYINSNNQQKVSSLKRKIYSMVDEYDEMFSKKKDYIIGVFSGTLCPNGITLVDSKGNATTMDLETYIQGVVAGENGWHEGDNIENLKAQAIAARTYAINRTNYCQKSIVNSQAAQVYSNTTNSYIQRAVEETSGMIIMYNGSLLSTEYDAFCVNSIDDDNNYIINQPSQHHPGQHQSIPLSFVQEMGQTYVKINYCYGHGRGMSQIGARYLQRQGYTYDQILQYYYPVGIEIVRPASTNNWKQYDQAWSGVAIGGSTVGAVGCYITSLAILISMSGAKTTLGSDFNPGTFAQYLNNHGAFDESGSLESFSSMSGLLSTFVPEYDSNVSASNIKNYIDQGKYVQVHIRKSGGGQHFMAVTGVEGENVYISDPGGTCTVLSECYPGKTVTDIRAYTIG